MTDEEHIEHLVTTPLDVKFTLRQRALRRWRNWLVRWERLWPIVQKISVVVTVVSVALAAVGIVLVVQLAVCTNTNLGKRNGPGARDALAHIAFADLIKTVTTKKPLTAHERAVVAAALNIVVPPGRLPTDAQILAGLTNYPADLAADQDQRDANPIGKC